jgi:hypothetical protein
MPSPWEPALLLLLYVFLDLAIALGVQVPAARAAAHAARARRAAAVARADAKAASSPATFAASAKLERQALAYEREADRAEREAGAARAHPRLRSAATLKAVASLALAWRWWGGPVVALGPGAPWPLGWWAAQPHGRAKGALFGGVGGVAALPWAAVCSRASAAAARALLVAGAGGRR